MFNLKRLQIPVGGLLSFLNAVPCKDKLVQWFKGAPVNGTWIDRVGASGSEVWRDGYNGAKFVGDGTAYVDTNRIFLDTSDWEVEIEFIIKDYVGEKFLITQYLGGEPGRLNLNVQSGTGLLRLQVGGTLTGGVVSLGQHIVRVVKVGTTYTGYLDGSESFSGTLTDAPYASNTLINGRITTGTNGVDVIRTVIRGVTFNFEESNTDTKVIGTSADGPVIGEIQNATGSERVRTTDLPSSADIDGHVVAKALGKNLIDVSNFMVNTFISGTTGNFGTLAGTRTSQRLKVNPNTDYYLSTDDRATFRYEDKDGNVLSFIEYGAVSEIGITTPNNCEYLYVYYSRDGTDANEVQLEQGTAPTTYEPWEGMYYNDDETGPIPDGVIIPVLNGKAQAYLADGTQPNAVAVGGYSGSLKANAEYNKGSFTANGTDNYLDTGIVPNQDTVMKVWGKFNSIYDGLFGSINLFNVNVEDWFWGIISNNWRADFVSDSYNTVSADTKNHVFEFNSNGFYIDCDQIYSFSINLAGATNSVWLLGQNQGQGGLAFPCDFTIYKAEIIHNGQTHIWDFNPNNDEAVVYTIDGVVQTPPTIQGTVTSGQWGTTGYVRNLTTKYDVVQADKLTTVQMYDHTDPDNVVAKVVPVDDFLNQDNPRFSKTESGEFVEQVLYDDTSVDPCLSKVQSYLGF